MKSFTSVFTKDNIYSVDPAARELHHKSQFGEINGERVVYMPEEAYFLLQQQKMTAVSAQYKALTTDVVLQRLLRADKQFLSRFAVFMDLRTKGYVVKSGLKFGGDFRVYNQGTRVKHTHAPWICVVTQERTPFSLAEFAAKNRVAHASKKRLLFALLDFEGDVSYYETTWKKIV